MKITVRDYINGKYPPNKKVYIDTCLGREEVEYIRCSEAIPWVVCSKGFMKTNSWCVHYDTELEVED